MSNLNEFIERSARVMAADRPDLWSEAEAKDTLDRWATELVHSYSNDSEPTVSIGTGGFTLSYTVEDSMMIWELTRSVLDFVIDPTSDADSYVFDWTNLSKLFNY